MNSLGKFIAQAGVCSRRKAVELIKQAAVTVNGHTIVQASHKLKETDVVKVGNKVIKSVPKVYVLLHKPRGYITSVSDDKGRKTVMDLLAGAIRGKIYPVGRLDAMTTGLLLMTNDGELAQHLSHPRYEVRKVYHVTLTEPLLEQHIVAIEKGVRLIDGVVTVDHIKRVPGKNDAAIITLHSGKYRVIRRLFEALGYFVKRLNRSEYAALTLHGLPINTWRFLTTQEITHLKNYCSL
jgi:23S rRNA pseudouridine2605 synthase